MLDERSLDEKLAPQTFVDDFVWAARALRARPSVALVSVAFWVLPTLSAWAPRHRALGLACLLVLPLYTGWFGAERLFFLRWRDGDAVTAPELLSAARSYVGRFARAGLLMAIATMPVWVVFSCLAGRIDPTARPAATRVMMLVTVVPIDLLLTFVPSALVFTTRSAYEALRIGWSMIRDTWPRSGLYVLCPPLALNMLNAIYPTHIRAVQVAAAAVLSVLALLAKGATVAFYLRERPVSPDMEASTRPPSPADA